MNVYLLVFYIHGQVQRWFMQTVSGEAILVPPVRPFFFDFVNCEDVVAAIVVDGF